MFHARRSRSAGTTNHIPRTISVASVSSPTIGRALSWDASPDGACIHTHTLSTTRTRHSSPSPEKLAPSRRDSVSGQRTSTTSGSRYDANVCGHTHTHTRTNAHTHKQTHIHTHTHTLTHMLSVRRQCVLTPPLSLSLSLSHTHTHTHTHMTSGSRYDANVCAKLYVCVACVCACVANVC